MARILAMTNGMLGMRYATIELGRRLAAAGHDVVIAGAIDDRTLVHAHGLSFERLPPDGMPAFRSRDRKASVFQRLKRLTARREQAIEATGVAAFRPLLEALKPDLVLLDQEMQEHVVVAAGLHVPVALMNTFCSVWRMPGSPPPHTTVVPGQGLRGTRLGITLAWTAFRLRKQLRFLRLRVKHVGCDRPALLRLLARETGVDFRALADASHWLIPYVYPAIPTLSLHALEFEFSPEPPPGVTCLGPMQLADRGPDAQSGEEREELQRLLEAHARSGNDRRLLYAGFGSVFTVRRRWLKALFAAIAERPDWDLVLSLGGSEDPAALGEVPDNVHVYRWPPQLELLARAEAAIVHGGINTIDECVLAGVPMLVCCGHETDMAGNMARVVHHGIGLAADTRRDDTGDLVRQLAQLLDDEGIAARLERMQTAYRAYAGEGVAERVIESLLSASTRSSALRSAR